MSAPRAQAPRPLGPGQAFAEAVADPSVTHLSVPAPLARPEALLALRGKEPAVLFAPPSGPRTTGLGVAAECRPSAAPGETEAWVRQTLAGLSDASDAPAPRVYGALPFEATPAPDADGHPPWSTLGPGRLVLPRWRYLRSGQRAWLSLALPETGTDRRALDPAFFARRGAALLEALHRNEPPAPAGLWSASVHEPDPELFRAGVRAATRAVRAGQVSKVVLARTTEVTLPVPVDPAAVLDRLAAEHGSAFRLAFIEGPVAFLAATPERLVARHDRRVFTSALAGTIASPSHWRERQAAGEALLARDKDRREHAWVVDVLRAALGPLTHGLAGPAIPEVMGGADVLHLHTPLTGTLEGDTHVLSLVGALHPTPAVGGVPRAKALDFIAAHEPGPRGWYAAPFGWCDAAGDGEFVVAIRSALTRGRTAWVPAGAGLVDGSDPDGELAETRLKQRTLFRALGVVP